VHRFGDADAGQPHTATVDCLYAPVVLHFTNCGFYNWRRKYEILCTGHKTADGAFSLKKGGIKTVRSHLAARELALRGGPDFATGMEHFYRTFIMGDECGELAHFAQHGIVVRVDWIAKFLEGLTADEEEQRAAVKALPPAPKPAPKPAPEPAPPRPPVGVKAPAKKVPGGASFADFMRARKAEVTKN
jgi:hypothetical protein